MHFNQALVSLVTLGDIVVVVALVLLRRGILAALPIVAIYHEHIFYVQVVRKKLALYLLLLLFQQRLHHWHLTLRVDHVNGPFLTTFLLFYGRGSSGHHSLTIHYLQGIAALEFLQQPRQRIPALEPGSHIAFDPIQPNDIKAITPRVHLIIINKNKGHNGIISCPYSLQYTSNYILYFNFQWRKSTRRPSTMPCSRNSKISPLRCPVIPFSTRGMCSTISDSSRLSFKRCREIP